LDRRILLHHLRASLGPKTRLLIVEQVMSFTCNEPYTRDPGCGALSSTRCSVTWVALPRLRTHRPPGKKAKWNTDCDEDGLTRHLFLFFLRALRQKMMGLKNLSRGVSDGRIPCKLCVVKRLSSVGSAGSVHACLTALTQHNACASNSKIYSIRQESHIF
jgi:hypothetical protein